MLAKKKLSLSKKIKLLQMHMLEILHVNVTVLYLFSLLVIFPQFTRIFMAFLFFYLAFTTYFYGIIIGLDYFLMYTIVVLYNFSFNMCILYKCRL